ncbi:hypothetical protein ColKHC_14262 [Colletotrichum higginsianum]|nr:hypothetical protein ColKHC_14262 [Colletotrichum higginsianum]
MRFYGCSFTVEEVKDLAMCMSYEPEASGLPPTTREGILRRDLGWVEQLLTTDYSRLEHITSFDERPARLV